MTKLFVLALAISAFSFSPAKAEIDFQKPLDLKFTAVDGRHVDFAQLRGKVVLLDFWATWCPACRLEMPEVLATYKKYHDQGFEVIGISLDQEKDTLTQFTNGNEMPWPQYFDGQGWDNSISTQFGVTQIPAMLLIGKDGRIVQAGGASLDDLVAKLLQTK